MELRHLRYFVAVAERLNVRMAAERLHITQPAISRQIQDLEEEIGATLFDRSRRGLTLTAAGKVFLDAARRILADVSQATHSARQVSLGMDGSLKLAMVDSAGWDGPLPKVIGEFQSAAPNVRLQIAPMNTPAQLDALQAGEFDAGAVYLLDPPPANLDVIPLAVNDVILAVPARFTPPPGGKVRAADLNGQPLVTFNRAVYPSYHDLLFARCREAGLSPSVIQEVDGEGAELTLVSAGIGIALVNSANLARPPAGVRFVPLADLSLPLTLSFAYLRTNPNPALHRLVEIVQHLSRGHGSRISTDKRKSPVGPSKRIGKHRSLPAK